MISTKMHAVIDYLMGVLLVLLPFILDLQAEVPTIILFTVGGGTIFYSLFTNYEISFAKVLSMKTHLTIDLFSGIFLVAAPWIFGFANEVNWLFPALGTFEVLVSLLTRRTKKEK